MTCTICGQAEPQPGIATMTLERENATFVMKGVPALVCPNCREEYVSPEVSARVLEFAEHGLAPGPSDSHEDCTPTHVHRPFIH